MQYVLMNDHGQGDILSIQQYTWDYIISEAKDHGWQPEQELTSYLRPTLGLKVSVRDAQNLAKALERWLQEKPGDDNLRDQVSRMAAICRAGSWSFPSLYEAVEA